MEVGKEKSDGSICSQSPQELVNTFLGRIPVVMELADQRELQLISKGKTLLLTVSKYVLESTVETLRLKREDYLKMIRDIKRIQSEGTERMENFLKLKQ